MLQGSRTVGLALVLAVVVLSTAAAAAENVVRPTVEVVPGTVDLAGAGQVRADVLLHNDTEETLYGARLSVFSNAGVTVTWKDSQVTVPPKTTVSWSISIAPGPDTLLPGTVQLQVTYGTSPSRTGDQAVVATLNVNDSGAELIEKLASVNLETTAGPLTDYRSQAAYLQITNNSGRELTATVTWHGPGFVKIIPQESAGAKPRGNPATAVDVTIPAHDKVLAPFTLKLEGAIEPGKHKLMFETKFRWLSGSQQRTGTLLVPYEITSNILGESEALQLLGIPSFLLMPGALLLMVIAVLRKLGWKISRSEGGSEVPIPSDIKSAEFWVLAITLSIIAGFIFYLVKGRTYLSGYSTHDMLQVWAGTVLFGVLAYAAAHLAHAGYVRHRAAITPSEQDSPLAVLHKLERTSQGLKLEALELTLEGHKHSGFLFGDRSRERPSYWVLPRIIVKSEPNASPELQKAVDEAITEGKTADLVRLLESGIVAGVLQVSWDESDGFSKPYAAKEQEVHFCEKVDCLVKMTT